MTRLDLRGLRRRVTAATAGALLLAGGTALVGPFGLTGSASAAGTPQPNTTWLAAPGADLIPSDGVAGDHFGGDLWYDDETSPSTVSQQFYNAPGEIALSADGSVAVVGSPGHTDASNTGEGAAYVYTRSSAGGPWQQAAELVPSDGATYDGFGWSVAISPDGSTIAVGAPYHAGPAGAATQISQGAVYVFNNTGGSWKQQAELRASDPADYDNFGWSVALGGTAAPYTLLASAPSHATGGLHGSGEAYVFSGSGTSWSQTQTLTDASPTAEDAFGTAVALDQSGNTALISKWGWVDTSGVQHVGGADVFTESAGSFTQSASLANPDAGYLRSHPTQYDEYGNGVALSPDGGAALVGAPDTAVSGHADQGAAYLYQATGGGGSWSAHSETTLSDPLGTSNDAFGGAVALAPDAAGTLNAFVGALGVVYDVPLPGSGPGTATTLSVAGNPSSDGFGMAVAASTDGSTVAAVAPQHAVDGASNEGDATVFETGVAAPSEQVSGISPASGDPGTLVKISGSGFGSGARVQFGTTTAQATVDSATTITAIAPDTGYTPLPVSVTTDGVTATATQSFAYPTPALYQVSPATAAPGSTITLTGAHFANPAQVLFGTTALSVTVDSADSLSAAIPPGVSGEVQVSVSTGSGTSNAMPLDVAYPATTTTSTTTTLPSSGGSSGQPGTGSGTSGGSSSPGGPGTSGGPSSPGGSGTSGTSGTSAPAPERQAPSSPPRSPAPVHHPRFVKRHGFVVTRPHVLLRSVQRNTVRGLARLRPHTLIEVVVHTPARRVEHFRIRVQARHHYQWTGRFVRGRTIVKFDLGKRTLKTVVIVVR